ncbi:hypothetical protein GJQ57_04055 [Ralstonia pickettii]|uniref:Polymer-forming cytoskeletal protein n=1 Tax=Ralstonia pickettii TaxID=329 RepID=A0A7X2HJV5_RALPI|nr:hypothetical protein [Ralstonia pickettii]MRS97825.1 hypothetical protein [Ralstonia pickettii]NWK47442.1 hypothetical protein [Ralstonia pickettii]
MIGSMLLLSGSVAGLLVLPFLPALSEWLRPTDSAPLPMRRDQPNNLTFFANSFRRRLQEQYGVDVEAMRAAGAAYQVPVSAELSVGRDPRGRPSTEQSGLARMLDKVNHIVVFRGDAWLAPRSRVRADLYVEHDIEVERDTRLRACLAEGDIELGENVVVQRWVHGRNVRLQPNVRVEGRVTAEERIVMAAPARFERAGATEVMFGDARSAAQPVGLPKPATERRVLDGDAILAANEAADCDYVVRGDCRVAGGMVLQGSIKTHGHLRTGDGVRIAGTLSARKNLEIGAGSAVLGPLIGFEDIVLGPNCRIGRPDAPTTLVCNRLFVSPGCVVHGVITAHEFARVDG